MSDNERLTELLKDLAPYVVVVGSFARHAEDTRGRVSDIDCYLRRRPLEEVDCEIGNETYMGVT